jgi:fucose permease
VSVTGAMVLPWVSGHLAAAFGVQVVLLVGAAAMVMVALLGLVAHRR